MISDSVKISSPAKQTCIVSKCFVPCMTFDDMNQAVNFFWTILCFIPVLVFWSVSGNMIWCYVFMAISLIGLAIPAKWLQLSSNPQLYEKLGIRFIKKFVQNGDYANRLARRSDPNHRVVKHKANAGQYLKTIVMYERYHLFCLLFFTSTAILAIIQRQYPLSLFVMLANIVYNVCPIILQQYNKARLMQLKRNII